MSIRTFVVCALLILLSASQSGAQTSELWADYYANIAAGGGWVYELNPGFSKTFAGGSALDTYLALNATYEWERWLNPEANLEAHYTFDKENENVVELRPWAGLNFIWPTHGQYLNLFNPFFAIRLEERFLWYQESGTEDTKTRLRFRISAKFPVNNELLVDGTYYLIVLAETYVPLNGDPKEISASQNRFQGGLGYVVGADFRIELQYVMMRKRNTYTNGFETSSNILWLAVRHFF
jgi:hypothetical protein